MNSDYTDVTLETIGGGVAKEKFQDSLTEVISNILDVNMDSEAVREVHVVLKMKPGKESRAEIGYQINSYVKLAKPKAFESKIHVGISDGEIKAVEQNIVQPGLFDGEKDSAVKIVKLEEM